VPFRCRTFAALALCCVAAPARAGINVASYQTVALTNAYAPLSQAQYFDRQARVNISPAVADVSDDWTGTNIGGSTPTWHWVGSAHTSTATTISADSLTITGAGSFSYDLTTTADFIDPTSAALLYTPGSAADFSSSFEISAPGTFSVQMQLSQFSLVHLDSQENGIVFDRLNATTVPVPFGLSGTVPPGHYHLQANASHAGPNLFPGQNHIAYSGSFDNFSFSVQVPEPASFAIVIALALSRGRRRVLNHPKLDRDSPSHEGRS
jgi:hypothetical protein